MRQQLRPFEAFQVLFRIDGCNEVGAKAFDWGLENKDKLIKLFEMADGRDHLWALIFDQKLVRVHVREDGEEHTPDVSLVRQGASSYSVMEHLEQAVKFSEILGPLTIEDINGISLRVHPGNSASELYDMFKTKMQNNQPSKQR